MEREPSESPEDPFELLGVRRSASMKEIDTAYRRLVKIHHPDLHPVASEDERRQAEARMLRLNEARRHLREQLRQRPVDVRHINWERARPRLAFPFDDSVTTAAFYVAERRGEEARYVLSDGDQAEIGQIRPLHTPQNPVAEYAYSRFVLRDDSGRDILLISMPRWRMQSVLNVYHVVADEQLGYVIGREDKQDLEDAQGHQQGSVRHVPELADRVALFVTPVGEPLARIETCSTPSAHIEVDVSPDAPPIARLLLVSSLISLRPKP